jgi:hypothetical protein
MYYGNERGMEQTGSRLATATRKVGQLVRDDWLDSWLGMTGWTVG